MADPSVIHSTFILERSYPVPPERVFAAFADPAQKCRWFTQGENHDVEMYAMDFRIGGAEQFRYRFKAGTPFAGVAWINQGTFQDIVPHHRIVSAYTMRLNEQCISASLVTVEMLAEGSDTKLLFTHQGAYFEGADGPDIREAGWRKLLDILAVELAR